MSRVQRPPALFWIGALLGLLGIAVFTATILGAFGRPQAQPGEAASLRAKP